MIRYRLVCAKEDRELLEAVCRAHAVILDDASPCVLCEEGVSYNGTNDILIIFKKEKIETLMVCLQRRSRQDTAILMGAADSHFTPLELPRIAYIRACGNDTCPYRRGRHVQDQA